MSTDALGESPGRFFMAPLSLKRRTSRVIIGGGMEFLYRVQGHCLAYFVMTTA